MARRLSTSVAIALALAGFGRVAPAQSGDPPLPPVAEAPPLPPPGPEMVEGMPPPQQATPPPSSVPTPSTSLSPEGLPEDGSVRQTRGPGAQVGGPTPSSSPPGDDAAIPNATPGRAPDTGPLPGATEPAATTPAAADRKTEPYVIPAERLPEGAQAVGLVVDVQAPREINLNQPAKFRIVVRNTGETDVAGVVVRDLLPEGLEPLGANLEAQIAGQLVTWTLGDLRAKAKQELEVRVRPVSVGSFDHAPTVALLTGARARTRVTQPKLRVEQTVSAAKVLKGQQVRFDILVSNPGTGPARDVVVRAKLSPGLRHDAGSEGERNQTFEQEIKTLRPGESVKLDPLVVDTLLGGKETCEVGARSPDVIPETDEAHALQTIEVVEPRLKLTLMGPTTRFAGTTAPYRLVIENTGTAPALRVGVAAFPPIGGKPLVARDAKFEYDPAKRRLLWAVPRLEPNERREFDFQVRLEGIQRYRVYASAAAAGGLSGQADCTTDVAGLADVRIVDVLERSRALDIGDQTDFEVRIKNYGSKEASRLLIGAKVSENIEVVQTAGTEDDARKNPANPSEIVFPVIDRLAPDAELVLTIRVRALKPDIATCKVTLMYDELHGRQIAGEGHTTVMGASELRR
jgi:uncharacterized repeat protein (TIGR01451 family)